LTDVISLARSLQQEGAQQGMSPAAVGVGVAELVDPDGRILSEATIRWKDLPVAARLAAAVGLPVSLDADVRAAARGEARLGTGRSLQSFLYVTVGTGISASLVVGGNPFVGARGLTGTFASCVGLCPLGSGDLAEAAALEQFAAGPAIASRFAALQRDFSGTAVDVLALAEAGDQSAASIVASAGRALGAAIAHLVNVLDPEAVVLGGGLGLAAGIYRTSLHQAVRTYVWSEFHREIPLLSAALGTDAGWIGAALGTH
jgi:glucokinase